MKLTPHLLLAALLAALPARAQWPTSPEERLFIGYGVESRIVSDGEGGAFVVYTNYPGSTWNTCYLQKLDPQGYPQLSPPIELDAAFGTLTTAFEAVTDGEGGVIVAVTQDNTATWMRRMGVFRFSNECDTLYWNVDPDTLTYTLIEPKCSPDSAGGAYLLYGHADSAFTNLRMTLQHIGPSGERLWGDVGYILDIGLPPYLEPEWAMTADRNYCYATAVGDTLHAYKFTSQGESIWGTQGRIIPYLGDYPEMAADGAGGLVEIVKRSFAQDHLIAFRLDSLGNSVWPAGGIDLGVMYWNKSASCRYPFIYVAWDSGGLPPAPRSARMQKFDYLGNAIWAENLSLFSGDSNYFIKMFDANGMGLIVAGFESLAVEQWGMFSQKYNYEGLPIWHGDLPIRLSPEVYYPNLVGDDNGGAIFSWCEVDPLYGQLICAAMVNADGELGVLGLKPETSAILTPCEMPHIFPNPANPISKLYLPSVVQPNSPIRISILNVLGQVLLESEMLAATNIMPLKLQSLNTARLCSGLYLLHISAGEMAWTSRFLYLK